MLDQVPDTMSTPPEQQVPPPPPEGPDLNASKHNPAAKPPATPAPTGSPKPPPPPPKSHLRSFASVAASPAPEGWKVVQRKPNTKANRKKSPSALVAAMDDCTFELPHDTGFKLNPNESENITSRINRALYNAGISNTRVERVRCTETHRILGVTSPTSTLKDLLQHRDMVLKAARTVDASITDITAQQK